MEKEYPNIELTVKHQPIKKGRGFGDKANAAIIQQLSNLLRAPYIRRVKDVWCDDITHKGMLTKIMIDAEDKTYEITSSCCKEYEKKLNTSLEGVEDDN